MNESYGNFNVIRNQLAKTGITEILGYDGLTEVAINQPEESGLNVAKVGSRKLMKIVITPILKCLLNHYLSKVILAVLIRITMLRNLFTL